MHADKIALLAELGKDVLRQKMEEFVDKILSNPFFQNANPVYEKKLLLQVIAEVAIDLFHRME